MASDETVVTTVRCEYCGHDMTPLNPTAAAHICRTCLKNIQIGDRYTESEASADGE